MHRRTRAESHSLLVAQAAQTHVESKEELDRRQRAFEEHEEAVGLVDLQAVVLLEEVAGEPVHPREDLSRPAVPELFDESRAVDEIDEYERMGGNPGHGAMLPGAPMAASCCKRSVGDRIPRSSALGSRGKPARGRPQDGPHCGCAMWMEDSAVIPLEQNPPAMVE